MEPVHKPSFASSPSAFASAIPSAFWETIIATTRTRRIAIPFPPAMSALTFAWKPTEVKNSTMQTSRSVSV